MYSIINCIDCGYLSDKKREFVKLIHWQYFGQWKQQTVVTDN